MLKYIKVDKDNINLATSVQMRIFPEESAYKEFLDCINDDKEYNNYYIVYDDEKIIGITGLYTLDDVYSTNTLWMGWFGILNECRNLGYGKQVLLDTIDMAKKYISDYNIKYFRIFTSYKENQHAVTLYDKIMDFREEYHNKDDYDFHNSCLIYTKSLVNGESQLWNNRFLNIKQMILNEKISIDLLNQKKE